MNVESTLILIFIIQTSTEQTVKVLHCTAPIYKIQNTCVKTIQWDKRL